MVYAGCTPSNRAFSENGAPPVPTTKIEWEATTLQRLSAPGSAAFYPRMIALKDSSLLAAYVENGNIVVIKSTDGGRQWTTPLGVAAQQNGINRDTPELLQLLNGAVLLCYGSRPQAAMRGVPDSNQHFDIRIQESRDGGATWGFEKVLYTGGSAGSEGCWEPAAVQLPSGEIQLFFSNEAVYTTSNEQNISMLQSIDNGSTWSAVPQIVSFRKKGRDGMPAPLWLPEQKELLVAIEDPGVKNFKPYVIRSAQGGQWNKTVGGDDTARTYALATRLEDTVYAGAPCLRRLSSGETLLSYQSTEARKSNKDNNAIMVVALGDSNGRNFKNKSFPFDVPEGRSALWNSLCVQEDTVIAVTCTNAFSRLRPEVWMIKGFIKK